MPASSLPGIRDGAELPLVSWDRLAACFLVLLAIVAVLTFRDYGITWDEEIQRIYGDKLLAYYGSLFRDRSVFSLDNLFYYGGLFEIVAALAVKISPFGIYETRHLLSALVGILGAAGSWRLGRLLAGPRAGMFALALTALTPDYYGHSFFNPKDIPFATALIWALFFACRLAKDFPAPRPRAVLGFGLALGCALGIRIGGVLVPIYLAMAIALHFIFRVRSGISAANALRDAARFIVRILPAFPIAYALMAAFWPWSVQGIFNPIDALWAFSKMQWPGKVLLDGTWVQPSRLPFFYLPLILAIRLPEVTLLGLLGATGLMARWVIRERRWPEKSESLSIILLFIGFLFPIAYSMVFRPNIYHGYRHFLFLVPITAVLAALAWDRLLAHLAYRMRRVERWLIGALGATMLAQAGIMASLFPYEYIYYNAFIGGVRGAAGRFETDYWGSSLREATASLEQFVKKEDGLQPPRRYSVAVVCANPLSASYYFPPFLRKSEKVEDADFVVQRSNADCSTPIAGRIIAEVKRAGIVLSTVFDRRITSRAIRNR